MRVSAKLVRVKDQTQVWAETYDRDLRQVLALQSEVGQAIARGVERRLSPSSEVRKALARPLVVIEALNELDSIVAYVACLRAGFPVILVAEGQATADGSIVRSYAPNVIVRREADAYRPSLASTEPASMHPELAVLLSTSGTTAAAKLVRLSRANL